MEFLHVDRVYFPLLLVAQSWMLKRYYKKDKTGRFGYTSVYTIEGISVLWQLEWAKQNWDPAETGPYVDHKSAPTCTECSSISGMVTRSRWGRCSKFGKIATINPEKRHYNHREMAKSRKQSFEQEDGWVTLIGCASLTPAPRTKPIPSIKSRVRRRMKTVDCSPTLLVHRNVRMHPSTSPARFPPHTRLPFAPREYMNTSITPYS